MAVQNFHNNLVVRRGVVLVTKLWLELGVVGHNSGTVVIQGVIVSAVTRLRQSAQFKKLTAFKNDALLVKKDNW